MHIALYLTGHGVCCPSNPILNHKIPNHLGYVILVLLGEICVGRQVAIELGSAIHLVVGLHSQSIAIHHLSADP